MVFLVIFSETSPWNTAAHHVISCSTLSYIMYYYLSINHNNRCTCRLLILIYCWSLCTDCQLLMYSVWINVYIEWTEYGKLSFAYIQSMRYVTLEKCNMTFTLTAQYLLLQNSMSYAGMHKGLWNDGKWHVWVILHVQVIVTEIVTRKLPSQVKGLLYVEVLQGGSPPSISRLLCSV